MHCCIDFPGGSMSVADTLPDNPSNFGKGGHMPTISCDSAAQAEEVFARLSKDAKEVPCKIAEAFFAKRYGEVIDRFGVLWAVMYEEETNN
jgi:PhnB protein